MAARFFHRLGASLLDRTICASAGGAGLRATYGAGVGMHVAHFEESRLILIWGSNSIASNLHFWTHAQAAKRAGAKLVCIDPRRSETADKCHQHVALLPGTDGALALGLGSAGAEAASRFLRSSAGPSLRFVDAVEVDNDGDAALVVAAAAAPPFAAPPPFSPAVFDEELDGRRSLKSSLSSMPFASVVLAKAEMSASMSSVKGGGASPFGDDDDATTSKKGDFFARL